MAQDTVVERMLTTVDNPFDPFTQFDEWYAWDTRAGYHTLSLLARVTRSSDEHSDADREQAEEAGIDEVVLYNVSGMHRKVERRIPSSD